MPIFPTATADIAISRTSTVLADNGTQGGDATVAAILGQIALTDFLPRLMEANDVIEDVGATVTAYTVLAGDKNKTKRFLCTGACAVSVPAGMPVGYLLDWIQWGAGQLTFASASGAGQSIVSTSGLKSNGVYSSGVLRCVAANTWLLAGETVA